VQVIRHLGRRHHRRVCSHDPYISQGQADSYRDLLISISVGAEFQKTRDRIIRHQLGIGRAQLLSQRHRGNHRLDEGLLSEANLEKFGSGNQSRVGRLVVGAASIIVFVEMAVHDSLFQVAQRAELLDQIALYRGRKKSIPLILVRATTPSHSMLC
jgi:hypothetical protein